MKPIRYFSVCTGIGGFELGISQAHEANHHQSNAKVKSVRKGRNRDPDVRPDLLHSGRKSPLCVGYSEIDPYAIQIYQTHFPTHKNYGDITKINEKELPDFDLLVGGFPCQSFSVAGKRGGFSDTRGTIFFEIARIIREKQPRFLLLENVKGLLSHDEGRTFLTIISALDELGYDCQWQVLNSKDFGVPQNRERVYIVGHSRTVSRPEVFPFGFGDEEDLRKIGEEVSYAIDASYHKGINTGSQGGRSSFDKMKRQMIEVTSNVADAQRIYSVDGIAKTLKGLGGGLGAKTGMYQLGNLEIRRLTPLECERLQGFPDNWTQFGINTKGFLNGETVPAITISDTQRYKCCGNAVTTFTVQAIISRLLYEI